jgi:hypothetical protein
MNQDTNMPWLPPVATMPKPINPGPVPGDKGPTTGEKPANYPSM